MGGWGVDALLGSVTRVHKDLDVLVVREDVTRLQQALARQGFVRKFVWEESRWLVDDGLPSPSAFVSVDRQGRELDIHVIGIGARGEVIQFYDNPWALPSKVFASGDIAGSPVPCISVEAQIAMHAGYAIPEAQQRDIRLLASLDPHEPSDIAPR